IASGCSSSTHLCGSSGRDWNTSTQVSRYSDSGSTHSSGAAATSVEICAVTAINSPDGTAARKIQRKRSGQFGATASTSSLVAAATTGERSNNMPQPAISTTNKPYSAVQIRFCVCSENIGSSSTGYDSSARKLPILDEA